MFASMARAGQLARRGQFWRLFGIYLLATVATSIVGQVIAIPFAIVGVVGALFVAARAGASPRLLLSCQRLHRADRWPRRVRSPAGCWPCSTSTSGSARKDSTSSCSTRRSGGPGAAVSPSRPLLGPSPDPAGARVAREELSRSEYQESCVERFVRWVNDLIDRLAGRGRESRGRSTRCVAIALTVVVAGAAGRSLLSRLRRNLTVAEHGGRGVRRGAADRCGAPAGSRRPPSSRAAGTRPSSSRSAPSPPTCRARAGGRAGRRHGARARRARRRFFPQPRRTSARGPGSPSTRRGTATARRDEDRGTGGSGPRAGDSAVAPPRTPDARTPVAAVPR